MGLYWGTLEVAGYGSTRNSCSLPTYIYFLIGETIRGPILKMFWGQSKHCTGVLQESPYSVVLYEHVVVVQL